MPKSYAVRRGRDGPKIYSNWPECERAVKGWPHARYKGFPTLKEAEAWLDDSDPTIRDANANNTGRIMTHSHINPASDPVSTTGQGSSQPAATPPSIPSKVFTSDSTGQDSSQATPPSTPSGFFTSDSTGQDSSQPAAIPPSTPSEVFTSDFISLPSTPAWHNNASQTDQRSTSVSLSEEQQLILDLVKEGKNVFFTGSAGTGKSVLLREIINHFGGQLSPRLGITASTGIAAVNIGGVTLHSWAGIGLGIENTEILFHKIRKSKYSYNRWLSAETLIIDEISMIDGALYDKLEHLACQLRHDSRPFGGIQIILTGDFCQLPPVPGRDGRTITFAFEAKSWKRCFETATPSAGTIRVLTKVFRQKDESFIRMLNSLRYGQPDAATCAAFLALSREVIYEDGLQPCELFPLREQVREANEGRLTKLSGDPHTFHAMDIAGKDGYGKSINVQQATILLDKNVVAAKTVQLKIGAQVMLIKNVVQGRLVNGSIGQVIGFQSLNEAHDRHTEIADVDKSKEGKRKQGSSPEPLEECDYGSINQLWPIVRFLNGEQLLIKPAEFEVMNTKGEMEARRDQIPLILSWALSIHKSQGQTLERVKVNLHRIFERGQAYVALSRATRLDSLQVLGFKPSKIMAHPRVLEFYKQLNELCSPIKSTSSSYHHSSEPDEYDEYDKLLEEAITMDHSNEPDEYD